MNKLEPLGGRVVVRPAQTEDKTKSGIYIPDSATKEKPGQGEVVAVGPGKLDNDGNRVKMSINVGDKVMFTKYAPDEIEIDDEKYLVIREENLLAIIK